MTRAGTGRRIALPDNAARVCASCLTPRGNTRKGWTPITSGGAVVGWTCPECPTASEPVRREVTTSGAVRFIAVVNGSPGSDGKRRQLKRRFSTLDEARAWVTEVRQGTAEASTRGATYSDPSRLTVRVLCERWLAKREQDRDAGQLREVSLNGYRSALDAPLRHMGETLAREVTEDDVETLLHTLASVGGKWGRPLSHRSIVYALATLRQVFAYAVRRGWIKRNPAATVRPPKRKVGDRKAVRVWTTTELARFRQHVDAYADGDRFAAEPWLRAGMRLTLCGLRRSEVLGLDWQHVNLDAATVRVAEGRVKTGRGTATAQDDAKSVDSHRVVPVDSIHPGTAAALRALWLAQGRPALGLVIRDAAGEAVGPDHYSRRFRGLSDAAGVPDLGSIHNVRHTVAVALHDAGMEPRKAASLLGHKVTTHLAFYVPNSDAGAAEAAEAAGRVFAV